MTMLPRLSAFGEEEQRQKKNQLSLVDLSGHAAPPEAKQSRTLDQANFYLNEAINSLERLSYGNLDAATMRDLSDIGFFLDQAQNEIHSSLH